MAYRIDDDTSAKLNALAAPLVAAAYEVAPVEVTDGASDDEIAQARAIQSVVMAVNAILQSMPLNQGGVLIAMGAVSGTVLGQCNGDRRMLYGMFQRQMTATLAEIGAAMMPAQGNA